jgi:hypothetical protein
MASTGQDDRIFIRDDDTLGVKPSRVAYNDRTTRGSPVPVLRRPRDAPSDAARAKIPRDDFNDTRSTSLLPHTAVEPEQHIAPHSDMAPRNSLPPVLDRVFWERRLRFPTEGGLSIGSITDRLGLKRNRSGRGRAFYDSDKVRRLSDAVAVLASRLPTDAAGLVDEALNTSMSVANTNDLLERFGEMIWGTETFRPWLYEPSDDIDGYTRALRYANQDDRVV